MFDFIFQYDYSLLFSVQTIGGIIVGTILGTTVGALPGLNSTIACALERTVKAITIPADVSVLLDVL